MKFKKLLIAISLLGICGVGWADDLCTSYKSQISQISTDKFPIGAAIKIEAISNDKTIFTVTVGRTKDGVYCSLEPIDMPSCSSPTTARVTLTDQGGSVIIAPADDICKNGSLDITSGANDIALNQEATNIKSYNIDRVFDMAKTQASNMTQKP